MHGNNSPEEDLKDIHKENSSAEDVRCIFQDYIHTSSRSQSVDFGNLRFLNQRNHLTLNLKESYHDSEDVFKFSSLEKVRILLSSQCQSGLVLQLAT